MKEILTRDEARAGAREQYSIIQSEKSAWSALRLKLLEGFMSKVNPPLADEEFTADFGVSRQEFEQSLRPPAP